ncbi:MAG: J domain-containing protein [Sphingomicrobium sp.]|nr:J domain-containing protein [Sphingomonadales bacterium]
MASKSQKFHGRVEGAADRCGVAGCGEPGEFRAPETAGDFDGPGRWRYLCLEHVRAHNARYNYFDGMSPDQIEAAQSPIAGWERHTRAFAHAGSDPPPAWGDFADPLEAIGGRFRRQQRASPMDRFTPGERKALGVLGLKDDIDRMSLRKRYSELVRRYHPDRNGGDRSHERALAAVIDAYTLLKSSRAFA